ncbi:peptidoglycan DD-metalloendopeptidase family protein [Helicobacter sp. 11S02629-2]|uniref:peptidoglycan DD-metalloendopeptidase family protein n=1 Tax=Helicobacter sp. 11S02629-2 TaxID=1476195 RepID=UPI000BA4FC51|nr:peptidoglycan DD-metalloendopeptidase family protein [Helicobacter sp. 11S02629-2]PAF44133.1 hypothetical protein BKH40_05915 [Helicobacter sp. 11S02629-2]
MFKKMMFILFLACALGLQASVTHTNPSLKSLDAEGEKADFLNKASLNVASNGEYKFTSTVGTRAKWDDGISLLNFLDSYKIPQSLYYQLPVEDKELVAEIYAGATYYMLKDSTGKLLQAFIPISENAQIYINYSGNSYKLSIIPINYVVSDEVVALKVQHTPYQDLLDATGDRALAGEFISAYKNNVNFKKYIAKDDVLAVIYERKYRLGRQFGQPNIKIAMIETNKTPNYLVSFNDKYYNLQGKEMTNFLLITPVKYRRISSKFSYGRRHPILGIIRPHYGVDFATPIGTPIHAAADGRVIFAGIKGGYGNVVEIAHADGIKTLYAHMHKILTRAGRYVKQGTVIGTVGTTGLSTGPHLHFGVYKNGVPVDPLGRIKTARVELNRKQKASFNKLAKELKAELDSEVLNIDNSNLFMKKIVQNM